MNRARLAVVAATLLVSYAYFFQSGGWNQNSRFDLTRAIVEQGMLRIDSYHKNTGDKAFFRGHFYSTKAPGLAFAAVPVVAAARPFVRAAGIEPSSPKGVDALLYLATVVTLALPTAVAGACLFQVALTLGASVGGGAFAAIAFGLATPMWCYATLFWGHALAAACLVFAFTAAVALREFDSPRCDLMFGTILGLATGWAVVTEYPAMPAAMMLVALALAHAWPSGRLRLLRIATGLAAGALPCAVALMGYQYGTFGSPFRVGYMYTINFASTMNEGFMGLTYPKWYVLRELLVGSFRGILPLAPIVGVAPLGFVLLWRRVGERKIAVVSVAIILYYVLLNAAFRDWHGGMTYGPRHLSPALPFLCIGLAPLWTRASSAFRVLLGALALFGAVMSLVAVSTTPMLPETLKNPVWDLLWPAFRVGDLSISPVESSLLDPKLHHLRTYAGYHPWNLGERAGLPGLFSLVPLFAVWAGALAAWVWLGRHKRELERDTSSKLVVS
jgi:hypothetical protein